MNIAEKAMINAFMKILNRIAVALEKIAGIDEEERDEDIRQ
jgi:hypothetical protein